MRIRPLAPVALVSLLAASSLVIAACGSDSQSNREASGGPTQAWSEGFGVTRKNDSYRGVEVDFVNNYRASKDVKVSIAASGIECRPDKYDDSNLICSDSKGGMGTRDIPTNQFGKWKSRGSSGAVLFAVGPDGVPYQRIYRSELTWFPKGAPESDPPEIRFSATNPAARKPRFTIQGGSNCLAGAGDVVVALSENQSRTLENSEFNCQIKLTVTRLNDSPDFKHFRVELK